MFWAGMFCAASSSPMSRNKNLLIRILVSAPKGQPLHGCVKRGKTKVLLESVQLPYSIGGCHHWIVGRFLALVCGKIVALFALKSH